MEFLEDTRVWSDGEWASVILELVGCEGQGYAADLIDTTQELKITQRDHHVRTVAIR